jgi:pentatricopeptide repeat protein
MKQNNITPDEITFMSVLSACADLKLLTKGKEIHNQIKGEIGNNLGTALVNMYGKCGDLNAAETIFHHIKIKPISTYNALISSFQQNSQPQKSLELFEEMKQNNITPDEITFVSVLSACADLKLLSKGKEIHNQIKTEIGVFLGTTLVNMYGKCGDLKEAEKIFYQMKTKNVFTYSALITSFQQNSQPQKSLDLFEEMKQNNITPDEITFVSVECMCRFEISLKRKRNSQSNQGRNW